MDQELDLQVLDICPSDSPLNSDDSYGSDVRDQFGDLTLLPSNGNNGDSSLEEIIRSEMDRLTKDGQKYTDVEEEADEILMTLSTRADDVITTQRWRHRLSFLTELDEVEKFEDPALIKLTNNVVVWPCDFMDDLVFKVKVACARKCKFPCCEQYTWPHHWARHRIFYIPKKHYLSIDGLSSNEVDGILRWSDLVTTEEWRQGRWTDTGQLLMHDKKKFLTGRVSWSVMEELLSALAYSKLHQLQQLAARLCVETLAKNKSISNNSHQYWGFAQIVVDLLKTKDDVVVEGLLGSLQLHLYTLKIFYGCSTSKCSEWASAGLLPLLVDLIGYRSSKVKAMSLNILILMCMNAPYVGLIANLGIIPALFGLSDQLTNSQIDTNGQLLRRRLHACLEMLARHGPSQDQLINNGILPLCVRQLSSSSFSLFSTTPSPGNSASQQLCLSSLITINSLCSSNRTLVKLLCVDNMLVVNAGYRCLQYGQTETAKIGSSRSMHGSTLDYNRDRCPQHWLTIRRQSLVLLCKLSVDEAGCKILVKRGVVSLMKEAWRGAWSTSDRRLVVDAASIMSRFPRAAEKMCKEGILSVFAAHLNDTNYTHAVLLAVSRMGRRFLPQMLEAGLMSELIAGFANKEFPRHLTSLVVSLLAEMSFSERVLSMIVTGKGLAYTRLLDIAFTSSDHNILVSAATLLGHLDTSVVPHELVQQNAVMIVAYVDKLLKSRTDCMVLYGLMQLQDYIQVEFMQDAFREHHVVKLLHQISRDRQSNQSVILMASKAAAILSGRHNRRESQIDLSDEDEEEEDGSETSNTTTQDKKYDVLDRSRSSSTELEGRENIEKDIKENESDVLCRVNVISPSDDEGDNNDENEEFELVQNESDNYATV